MHASFILFLLEIIDSTSSVITHSSNRPFDTSVGAWDKEALSDLTFFANFGACFTPAFAGYAAYSAPNVTMLARSATRS